ncbi:MAG: hypothetical protein R6X11_11210 [Desulfonatronovibrio sp.]
MLVEKVLAQQTVQKFQGQETKKVQGRSVFKICKSLKFLQQQSQLKDFQQSDLPDSFNIHARDIFIGRTGHNPALRVRLFSKHDRGYSFSLSLKKYILCTS